MIGEQIGLMRFGFRNAGVRRLAIILENRNADCDTFVADICSTRIVAWAGNQFLNDVLRFVAERAAQGFYIWTTPPKHHCIPVILILEIGLWQITQEALVMLPATLESAAKGRIVCADVVHPGQVVMRFLVGFSTRPG